MNIKALIKKYEAVECVVGIVSGKTILKTVLKDLKQLDEPETGHADEAPRYLKNILARLRELPDHDREVWLKAIMSEFKQDFSHAKWREGYEQGKLEGMVEREKVKEKQYLVKIKATKHYLVKDGNGKIFFSLAFKGYFTKKELEEAGFGWVFDCPGIEIEEVEV